MASPATDRLVKCECRFTWNSQLVENVFHVQHSVDAPDQAELTALANIIAQEVELQWLPLMASTVTFREVYVEEYADPISESATVLGAGVGSAAGESLGGNNAFCLSLRTAFTGRSRRGRFYTIGMTENQQTAGVVSSTYRFNWITALNDLRVALATANWDLVVASFWENGAPRPTGLVTPVTAVIAVDDFVDSQRRRLQGRGS